MLEVVHGDSSPHAASSDGAAVQVASLRLVDIDGALLLLCKSVSSLESSALRRAHDAKARQAGVCGTNVAIGLRLLSSVQLACALQA